MPFKSPSLLIGVSARIYYPTGEISNIGGVWTKTLHYLEQSVAQWLIREGALPVMIPAVESQSVVQRDELNLSHYAEALDGLLLQGGNDVAPSSYGEEALNPAWRGDAVRDHYEMALIRAFVRVGKPVFGICRGLQLLNVTFGGTLWQDIKTQLPQSIDHVNSDIYEYNTHEIEIVPETRLAELYPHEKQLVVNSIHHQSINKVAKDFVVEARSKKDGVVEAIRRKGTDYVAGVQWHPEFHDKSEKATFKDKALLHDFLTHVRSRKLQQMKGDNHEL